MVFYDIENNLSGTKLTEWPMHITLVPYFYPVHVSEQKAINKIAEIGAEIRPFIIITDEEAMFGPNNDIPVTRVVSEDNALEKLHTSLIEGLGGVGCHFIDLTFSKTNFAPHITHKSGREVPHGLFLLDSLTVANKYKEIITVIAL
jgi:2'-5' RNA ligase